MSDIMIHASNHAQITCISNVFIDLYMKEANGEYVKVYLYLLRCLGQEGPSLSISAIADKLDHTEKDIRRALAYWEKKGLLRLEYDGEDVLRSICLLEPASADTAAAVSAPADAPATDTQAAEETPAAKPAGYSQDQMDAFLENEDVRELLFIAERYMGRTLSATDMQAIIFWYDSLELSVDLIDYLISYCVDKGHASIHYMNKVALNWAASHFSTVEEAKQSASIHSQAYYSVMKAFGISGRSLAESETSYIEKWTEEYGFTLDIITEACKRTILGIHKPSFEYADKILSSWNSHQIHHLEDIARLDAAHSRQGEKKTKRPAAPVSGTSQNRFHNFSQRQYDYDALEQQLLQN